jgi:hypothetical protein
MLSVLIFSLLRLSTSVEIDSGVENTTIAYPNSILVVGVDKVLTSQIAFKK